MLTGLFLMLLALVGIIAIMVWIVQLPFVALLINIGLIALAAWIVQGPLVALLAIIGFIAVVLSALRWATTVDIRRHRATTPDVRTALDVLNARYARGEIDQAEYREKRALIATGSGGDGPGTVIKEQFIGKIVPAGIGRDEAPRIAANIAKLPELVSHLRVVPSSN